MLDSAAAVDDLNVAVVEELSKCLLHAINCIIACSFVFPYIPTSMPASRQDRSEEKANPLQVGLIS